MSLDVKQYITDKVKTSILDGFICAVFTYDWFGDVELYLPNFFNFGN